MALFVLSLFLGYTWKTTEKQITHSLLYFVCNILLNNSTINEMDMKSYILIEFEKRIDETCPSYQFPCESSFDEWNTTLCIDRRLHCDKKEDCPNGEDEYKCGK